jgi:DnaK suppressor protein
MRRRHRIDQARYDRLKRMLVDRERDVVVRLRALRRSLPNEWAELRDPEERGSHRCAEEVDFALVEMTSATATRIHEALARLDRGAGATCVDCGDAIGTRRLRALPFTDCCLACQQLREAPAAARSATFGSPAPRPRSRPAGISREP